MACWLSSFLGISAYQKTSQATLGAAWRRSLPRGRPAILDGPLTWHCASRWFF